MTAKPFAPTDEQARIIGHGGSAFITACPGAGNAARHGRTRASVARWPPDRAWYCVSFLHDRGSVRTRRRLRLEGLVETPTFPHFIGTFDAFLWQFLIAPFGVDGCASRPRLIPDKDDRTIQPFPGAQPLPLECFDRATGAANPAKLQRHRFQRNARAYETAAHNTRRRFLERGELDFADAREIALSRLRDPARGTVPGPAFAARFQELIVDEAQDCNPVDLEIITWFRDVGVPVKVICDPNQAIYGFRGGVTRELEQFAQIFREEERLPVTGNFRSSHHIARGIVAFRAPGTRAARDEALGEYRDEQTAVQIFSYSGRGFRRRSVPSFTN